MSLTCYTAGRDLSNIKRQKNSGGTDYKTSKGMISWTSTDKMVVLENLPNGTYKLHENSAPENYNLAADIWFKLVDGIMYDMDDVPFPNGIIVMIDTSVTDPGEEPEEPDYPHETPNGVESPQTSDDVTIFRIGMFLFAALLVLCAYQISDSRRKQTVKVNK